jgi:hypothetical protein
MADLFDLSKFKESIKGSLGSKPLDKGAHGEALFTMSLALTAAVKKVFFEKSETKFSAEPVSEKKPIIQFVQRMRVEAMEKFNQTTFFSVIHFHKDVAAMQANDPIGFIIVYIDRKFVPEMLRMLKYPYIDYDEDSEVLDGTGAIANLIAGQFKKELTRLGYADLEMSHFKSFINTAANGVEYPRDQTEKYEISFEIEDKKRLVVEMVMAPLAKAAVN